MNNNVEILLLFLERQVHNVVVENTTWLLVKRLSIIVNKGS